MESRLGCPSGTLADFVCMVSWLGLELMPFAVGPSRLSHDPIVGEGGVKAGADDPGPAAAGPGNHA